MDKSKKYISLQVTGNPDPHGGYRPIVSSNLVGEMIPVNENDYPGFSQNPFFFTFRIEDKRTLYTLVRSKVKSYGASRDGVSMKITISIPRGYRFESVDSPYDVLVELMDEFLQRAMTPIQGTDYYAYNKPQIEPTLLDDIARKYSLVKADDGPYRVMGGTGTAYIQLPDDKIRELLRDVHYPEFQPYHEIVVAELVGGTSYVKLPPLDIPRKPAYTVYVDGLPQQGTVKDKNKPLNYKGSKDSQCYDNSSVTFTLGELLAGKGYPGVTIDKANEAVWVDTSRLSKPKVTTWTLRFTPDTATQYFLRNKDVLAVYFDKGYGAPKPLPLDSKLSFTLCGEDLKLLDGRFKVSFNRKDEYEINGVEEPNRNGGNVNVTVERITRRPVTQSIQFQSGTSSNAQMPASQDCKLTITFAEGNPFGIGKDNRRKTFEVIFSDDSKFVTEVNFSQQLGAYSKTKPISKQWIGEISIPSSLVGRVKCIRFDCGKGRFANASWSGRTEVNDSEFKKERAGLLNLKFGFLRLVLMLLIALVVGFAAGYLTGGLAGWSFGEEETEMETVPEPQAMVNVTPPVSIEQPEVEAQTADTVKCEKCGAAFADSTAMANHRDREHTVLFSCDQCDLKFNTKDELTAHKNIKHPVLFNCDQCGLEFKTEEELKNHKDIYHKGSWQCPYCVYRFKTETELKSHVGTAHKGKSR